MVFRAQRGKGQETGSLRSSVEQEGGVEPDKSPFGGDFERRDQLLPTPCRHSIGHDGARGTLRSVGDESKPRDPSSRERESRDLRLRSSRAQTRRDVRGRRHRPWHARPGFRKAPSRKPRPSVGKCLVHCARPGGRSLRHDAAARRFLRAPCEKLSLAGCERARVQAWPSVSRHGVGADRGRDFESIPARSPNQWTSCLFPCLPPSRYGGGARSQKRSTCARKLILSRLGGENSAKRPNEFGVNKASETAQGSHRPVLERDGDGPDLQTSGGSQNSSPRNGRIGGAA